MRSSQCDYTVPSAVLSSAILSSARLASSSVLSRTLTCPEPSGYSTHPVKRQAPETSSHHSVRPISGAYHQLLNFFTLRFFILRAWS